MRFEPERATDSPEEFWPQIAGEESEEEDIQAEITAAAVTLGEAK